MVFFFYSISLSESIFFWSKIKKAIASTPGIPCHQFWNLVISLKNTLIYIFTNRNYSYLALISLISLLLETQIGFIEDWINIFRTVVQINKPVTMLVTTDVNDNWCWCLDFPENVLICISLKGPEINQIEKCNYLTRIAKTLTGNSALLSHLEDNINFISNLNDCNIKLSMFPRVGSKDYFWMSYK